MKHTATGLLVVIALAIPGALGAQTSYGTADTATQVVALLQEIQRLTQLLAQLQTVHTVAPPVETATCPLLSRPLSRGMSGSDVRSLQSFLTLEGSLAPGNMSGYFGPLTEAAVQAWQTSHRVIAYGTPDTTGYGVVGPATRAAIALACVKSFAAAQAAPAVSGALPEMVTFTVTPNTVSVGQSSTLTWHAANVGSCALYGMQKGESEKNLFPELKNSGSVKLTPADTTIYFMRCTPTRAGDIPLERSLGITVLGAPPPLDLAKYVFEASPTRGFPPLTVTIQAPVNASSSCAAGEQFMDFGDGVHKSLSYAWGGCGPSMYTLTHTYDTDGVYDAVLYRGAEVSADIAGKAQIIVGNPPESSSSASSTPAAVLDLAVVPANIESGATASIAWEAANVDSCKLTSEPKVYGSNQTSGETTMQFLKPGTITFTLACTGTDSKPYTQSATVTITQGAQMQI